MRYKNIAQILFLFILITASTSLFSQNIKGERKRPDPGKRWDRIEEFKKLKMIEELNLNEEESVKFYSKYNQLISQFRDIEKEKRKSIDELDKIINDPNRSAELGKKVEYIESLEQKLLSNRINFISDIKHILSMEKVARYLVFERNFQRELQNIVRDSRKPPVER